MNGYQHDRLVEYRRAEADVKLAQQELDHARGKLTEAGDRLQEAIDRDRPSWGKLPILLRDFDRTTP